MFDFKKILIYIIMNNINDILIHFYTHPFYSNYIDKHLNYNYDREEFKHFIINELAKKDFEYYIKYINDKKLRNLLVIIMRNNIKSTTSPYFRAHHRTDEFYTIDKFNELNDYSNDECDSDYFRKLNNNLKNLTTSEYNITTGEFNLDDYSSIIYNNLKEIYPNYTLINSKDWFNFKLFEHVFLQGYDAKKMSELTGINIDRVRKSLRETKNLIRGKINTK